MFSRGSGGNSLPLPPPPQSESRHSNRNHFCAVCLGKGQGMWLQKRAMPLGGAGTVSCLPPEGTGPGSHAGHGEGRKAAVPPTARGQAQGHRGKRCGERCPTRSRTGSCSPGWQWGTARGDVPAVHGIVPRNSKPRVFGFPNGLKGKA